MKKGKVRVCEKRQYCKNIFISSYWKILIKTLDLGTLLSSSDKPPCKKFYNVSRARERETISPNKTTENYKVDNFLPSSNCHSLGLFVKNIDSLSSFLTHCLLVLYKFSQVVF